MITVEKALKDSKEKNAVGEDKAAKNKLVKKLIIGGIVIAVIYIAYKQLTKGGNEKVQTINK